MTTRKHPVFKVTYWNPDDTIKETIEVRPAPLRGKKGGLSDVVRLQEYLIRDFVAYDGRLAPLLTNKPTWDNMSKLASLLPVVGREHTGFDIESLAESSDLAQLGRIFFSESIKDDLEREKDAEGNVINSPSLVAKIHDINFTGILFSEIQARQDKEHKERMEMLEEKLKEASPPPAT